MMAFFADYKVKKFMLLLAPVGKALSASVAGGPRGVAGVPP